MEALKLLKYWKTNSSTTESVKLSGETSNNTTTIETTAIVSAAVENETELEDDGPFFDLKLAVAEQNASELENDEHDDGKQSESDEKESKATFAATASSKGDSASSVPDQQHQQEETSKAQFHESVLKSATRLRVFMLGGSNKSKPKSTEEKTRDSEAKSTKHEHESKLFTVMKFRAEDVPFVSLFTRDTSKSASNNNINSKSLKQNMTESESDDKNGFSTEVVHDYLKKKVKPLYVRVSKPSGGVKLGLNTRAKSTSVVKAKAETRTEAEAEAEAGRGVSNVKSLASGLRNVRKHNSTKKGTTLAAVAAAPTVVVSTRRDDSLLQQQDGIQSAILHCKRSFNDDSRGN